MDYRRKEINLQMEKNKSAGWTVKSVPVPCPPEKPPVTLPEPPVTLPEPPVMPFPPVEECGYCITPAMAYIPMQRFTEVYEANEGFARGTIFAELDLPLWGREAAAVTEREVLLKRVQICDFALNDAALYLDTHPEDKMALNYYKKYMEMRVAAAQSYVKQFGPLTRGDYDGGPRWNWVDGPWPWQNEEA